MSKWQYDTDGNVAFADGSGTYERGWYAASPSTVEAGDSPEAGPFENREEAVRIAADLVLRENQVVSFTSGEWDSGGTLEIVAGKWGSDAPTIAVACSDLPRGIDGYANARLMAAAPKMLAVLEALFKECAMVHKHWGDNSNQRAADKAIKDGLAAIKLAKGEL